VELGRDLLARLGAPLSFVLQSARWAVQELFRRYALEFRRIYDERRRGGRGEVTMGSFFARTPLVGDSRGALSSIGAAVRGALQERWAEVLGGSSRMQRIAYRAGALRPA